MIDSTPCSAPFSPWPSRICADPAEKKCISSGIASQCPMPIHAPPLHAVDVPRFGQSSGDLGKVDKVTRMVASW